MERWEDPPPPPEQKPGLTQLNKWSKEFHSAPVDILSTN